MGMVIYNGMQYDGDALPAHVPAEKCIPAEKWFKDNKNNGGKDKHHVAEPVPEGIAAMQHAELNEIIADLDLDPKLKKLNVDTKREALVEVETALVELAGLSDAERDAVAGLVEG
ncbi:MAG: hypothetical protein AAGA37_19805 [Actinomycetota bacterium]